MEWYKIALLIIIIPVGAYLREIAYRPNKIIEDAIGILEKLSSLNKTTKNKGKNKLKEK